MYTYIFPQVRLCLRQVSRCLRRVFYVPQLYTFILIQTFTDGKKKSSPLLPPHAGAASCWAGTPSAVGVASSINQFQFI